MNHAPIPLYNAQRREYLKCNKVARKKNSQKDVDSGDLRYFKGKKGGRNQPISIRIDRFGRIAFNKDKELSQASLEEDEPAKKDKSPKSFGPEEKNDKDRNQKRYKSMEKKDAPGASSL